MTPMRRSAMTKSILSSMREQVPGQTAPAPIERAQGEVTARRLQGVQSPLLDSLKRLYDEEGEPVPSDEEAEPISEETPPGY